MKEEHLEIKKAIELIIELAELDRKIYNENYTVSLSKTVERLKLLVSNI